MRTPEFAKSRDEGKRVEMRFAYLKTHHRFERMRLRGLTGARDEFHLAAIAQTLETLAKHTLRRSDGHFLLAAATSESDMTTIAAPRFDIEPPASNVLQTPANGESPEQP